MIRLLSTGQTHVNERFEKHSPKSSLLNKLHIFNLCARYFVRNFVWNCHLITQITQQAPVITYTWSTNVQIRKKILLRLQLEHIISFQQWWFIVHFMWQFNLIWLNIFVSNTSMLAFEWTFLLCFVVTLRLGLITLVAKQILVYYQQTSKLMILKRNLAVGQIWYILIYK